jgi:sporulation protein YlmC with PRC-barrel domain
VIETDSFDVIGRLSDFSINILLGTVSQIEVTKTNFFFWKEVKLIDVNLIYEIESDIIYIKAKSQKIKQKKAEPLLDPA